MEYQRRLMGSISGIRYEDKFEKLLLKTLPREHWQYTVVSPKWGAFHTLVLTLPLAEGSPQKGAKDLQKVATRHD